MQKRSLIIILIGILIVSTISISCLYANESSSNSDMVLWYKFTKGGDDTTIFDASGNGKNGTLKGAASVVNGIGDGMLSLDGSSGYLQVPDNIMANLSAMTVVANVFIAEDNAKPIWAFSFGNYSTSDSSLAGNYFGMLLDDNSSIYRAAISDDKWSGEQGVTKGKSINKGKWKQVAVTLSGGVEILYEDGVKLDRKEYVTLKPSSVGNGITKANFIGKSQYSADKLLKGYIADFRVYNRALTGDEIQLLNSDLEEAALGFELDEAKEALDIANKSAVYADFQLPTQGKNQTTITWESSDKTYVTINDVNAIVTRPTDNIDRNITLTGTISKNGISVNKKITVTIIAAADAQDIFIDKENLNLGLTKVVTENLILPKKGLSGSDISWLSSNEKYIRSDGTITRPGVGEGDVNVKLTAEIKKGDSKTEKVFKLTVKEEYAAYVMSYFRDGGSLTSDTLHLAYSEDGLNWKALNGNMGIKYPKTGTQHIRDPFLFRKEDGNFVLLATNNWSSPDIYVWDSANLIDYTNERLIRMNNSDIHAWAPECHYDQTNGNYAIYWSGSYINSNTTKDFQEVSQVNKFFDPGFNCIDASLTKYNNKYYMVFKDERNGYKTIKTAKSDSLNPGSFSLIKESPITDAGTEGPFVIKALEENKWYLYYDYYNNGGAFGCSYTTDLESGNWTKMDTSKFSLPAGVRHGNTVMVTKNELQALKDRLGTQEVKIENVNNITVNTKVNQKPELPGKVEVKYNNGMTDYLDVNWNTLNYWNLSTPGTYEIEGTLNDIKYDNPIIKNRSDPYIYKHTDGYYYYTASYTDISKNNNQAYQYLHIVLRKAKTIQGLSTANETIIYSKKPLQNGQSPHVWAPEIHFIDGKWYIYYATTTSDTDKWNIRPHVMECADQDPITGKWEQKGVIKQLDTDKIAFANFSLDATTFEHHGKKYLVWAQNNPNSNLYIAEMANPWTLASEAVNIATPEYSWETKGYKVNEGAAVIKRNGKIYMTFSASGTDANYCMGLLTADEESNLLDASSWLKTGYPIFSSSSSNRQYGPGHNSFTVAEDGETDIMVYHGRTEEKYISSSYEPLYDAGRDTYVQKIFWNADNSPNLSIPGSKTTDGIMKIKAKIIVTD